MTHPIVADQQVKDVRDLFRAIEDAEAIAQHAPVSREASLVRTKLQEAKYWTSQIPR